MRDALLDRRRGQIRLEDDLSSLTDRAIALLQRYEPEEGYYVCFSGGKDSIVIAELCRMAGVKYDLHYSVTTIDPPELVQFIKREYPEAIFHRNPKGNFFKIMETNGFPTRRVRWCCKEFKEHTAPRSATIVMGVRAEESAARSRRWKEVVTNHRLVKLAVNPIFRWASDEIWQFIRDRDLEYCSLYDEGWHRLGCVGCPMARKAGRLKEFARWPRIEMLWKRGFQKYWDKHTGGLDRKGRVWFGDRYWANWEGMWDWWMSDGPLPNIEISAQVEMFGSEEVSP